MKENVSGCFFSEHSVQKFKLVASHNQDLVCGTAFRVS